MLITWGYFIPKINIYVYFCAVNYDLMINIMAKINPIMQAIRESTPPEVNRQVDIAVQIANRVYELLEEKGMSQKDLAKKLGKTETEVSRWLSGTHNLTIATIAKLAVALEDDIITTTHSEPQSVKYNFCEEETHCSKVADTTSLA